MEKLKFKKINNNYFTASSTSILNKKIITFSIFKINDIFYCETNFIHKISDLELQFNTLEEAKNACNAINIINNIKRKESDF